MVFLSGHNRQGGSPYADQYSGVYLKHPGTDAHSVQLHEYQRSSSATAYWL